MHKEGAINPGDYFDLKDNWQMMSNTENNRQLLYSSRVKLAALLNMDENQLGELDNLGIKESGQRLDAKQLYEMAVDQLPDIQALDYRIKVAERDIKIAKSYYYPSLSLSAGLGSNYSKLGFRNVLVPNA
jgi:outer membrane protein